MENLNLPGYTSLINGFNSRNNNILPPIDALNTTEKKSAIDRAALLVLHSLSENESLNKYEITEHSSADNVPAIPKETKNNLSTSNFNFVNITFTEGGKMQEKNLRKIKFKYHEQLNITHS